jgi:hypothetical protein
MKLVWMGMAALLAGCQMQTSFRGDAMYPGGAPACRVNCQREGLEMSSFVYSGEFATSCVCSPPSAPPQASTDASAAVGVVMQMRAADEEAQRRRQAPTPPQH